MVGLVWNFSPFRRGLYPSDDRSSELATSKLDIIIVSSRAITGMQRLWLPIVVVMFACCLQIKLLNFRVIDQRS
jgi:hypothetical protein